MKRRFAALLLALCVLFRFAAVLADDTDDEDFEFDDEEFETFDEEEEEVDFRTIAGFETPDKYSCGDFSYMLSEDSQEATLISYVGSTPDVEIPETVDGHPVVAIGDFTFSGSPALETVHIHGGIRSVGNSAFKLCMKLKRVVMDEGVRTIDYGCFGGCYDLTEITLPETLEEVHDYAFAACSSLEEVSFGTNLRSIGHGAFQLCSSLKKVVLPGGEGVSREEDSFLDCSPELAIVKE